ncbi:hypothetical protein SeMB42_g05452 [Synchytrium endobioticum]|uniref:guanosine-diphosphatase n=1 Tax=Synchytrium endobioticum TaxID=286115 RepID=A0A507CRA4_9FUNG|nr:hypothetical protein SeMB42_g05452 [Synchytrium endobioticum]TPX45665.1 hypothetical protein SeLEV6574_g03743 [Synchytrium endobioticum]
MPPSPKPNGRLPSYRVRMNGPGPSSLAPVLSNRRIMYTFGALICILTFWNYWRDEAEPLPLGRSHCTVGYNGASPVQYALMIDAGSTGSRIHIYEFSNCGPSLLLSNEVFKETKPGLSHYQADADAAAASLDVLLDEAVQVVPKHLHGCTPIEVKATAGLRLLGPEMARDILHAVRKKLQEEYPFVVPDTQTAVAVMDGKDEGVFAWITVNYLLDRFTPGLTERKHSIQSSSHKTAVADAEAHTVAIMDLGGASTQIVFEPLTPPPDPHRVDITLSGRTYTLYQHSYLGNGLMEARKATKSKAGLNHPPVHPCLAPDHDEEIIIALDSLDTGKQTSIIRGKSDLEFDECHTFVTSSTLDKAHPCKTAPCSFNGIHHPSLDSQFPMSRDIYAFSYFYDKTQPYGLPSEFEVARIRELGVSVCDSVQEGVQHFMSSSTDGHGKKKTEMGGMKWDHDTLDRAHLCLDLAYIYGLLKDGYGMSDDRRIQIAKKINGFETGWCLGAALKLANEHQGQCRISALTDDKKRKGPVLKNG